MKKKFFLSVFTLMLLALSLPSVSETMRPTSKCKDVGQLISDADCSNYYYECDTNLDPIPFRCSKGEVFYSAKNKCGILVPGTYVLCG